MENPFRNPKIQSLTTILAIGFAAFSIHKDDDFPDLFEKPSHYDRQDELPADLAIPDTWILRATYNNGVVTHISEWDNRIDVQRLFCDGKKFRGADGHGHVSEQPAKQGEIRQVNGEPKSIWFEPVCADRLIDMHEADRLGVVDSSSEVFYPIIDPERQDVY